MLRKIAKVALVLASSAVVIPYAVALLAEMLYGWSPSPRKRYYRALHPRKVYALNYALIMELPKLLYIGLCNRWTRYYNNCTEERLIKDIAFGRNKNFLDIYKPLYPFVGDKLIVRSQSASASTSLKVSSKLKPVVIFIYGGTWGSGDKNIYGLLCSQLADFLDCIVLCPNYSIYPKGFVDDMVQDIGDVMNWVQQNISEYGGDKNRVALIGHSAGAHLAMLTVLELCLKRLESNPSSLSLSRAEVAALASSLHTGMDVSILNQTSYPHNLNFVDTHFNGKNEEDDNGGGGDGAKASFVVVKDEGNAEEGNGGAGESFYMVDEKLDLDQASEVEKHETEASEEKESLREEEEKTDEQDATESTGDVISNVPQEIPKDAPKVKEERESSIDDLLSPIKLVIGLAGVYDIAEHYKFESWKGVEDISTMARAMYGIEQFDNFSPTVIARSLPSNIRLPPIHLLHGDADHTVPVSSSLKFGDALWGNGIRTVQASILSGCSHIDICFDLMDTERRWFPTVMTEIKQATSMYL